MKYYLSEIAAVTGGRLVGGDRVATDVIFDSRRASGSSSPLFVAIRGAKRDGHLFIPELIQNGIDAFLVEEGFDASSFPNPGFIFVSDTVKALQTLAAHHRSLMTMPVVAVAGSAGKTIVKEWIFQCWGAGPIFRSPRSYNSQLGVALSLLMLDGDEQLAVIETAISQPGEMELLEAMVRPDIAIITNIGDAHGANFLSKEEKLAEKLKIARRAQAVIFPADHRLVAAAVRAAYPVKRLFSWGRAAAADLRVLERDSDHIRFSFDGSEYTIPLLLDDNNVYENLMSVISLYAFLGLDLGDVCLRASRIEGVEVRLKVRDGLRGSKVITDTNRHDINAVKIALDSLSSIAGGRRKVLILDRVVLDGLAPLLAHYDLYKIHKIDASTEVFADSESLDNSAVLIISGEPDKISELFEEKHHTTVMEVDLAALRHNYLYYRSLLAPGVRIVAMVKAFSYGSGSYEVAEALVREGVDYLAVAYLDEGITLREKGITTPIMILNANPGDYDLILSNRLEPEIYSLYTLKEFIAASQRRGFSDYPVHLKLDTGMSRLGFPPQEMDDLEKLTKDNPYVRIASLFSHLSSADMPDADVETERQGALFARLAARFPYALRHLANSAAAERFPSLQFDMVRLGIGLYGLSPVGAEGLENVASLRTIVLQVRELTKGATIGYGMCGKAERDMTVATIGIGYADGLRRALGNGRWSVRLREGLAPIVGNVCMDTCMIDVTGLNVREGDSAVVFDSASDIDRIAEILGTIPYEVLTSVSARIKRVYLNE